MGDAKVATATSSVCLLGRFVGQAEVIITFSKYANRGDVSAERQITHATRELETLVKKYREQSRLAARL